MKLLVAEILYPQGHKALDNKYVELLAEDNDVDLLDNRNFFKGLPCSRHCKLIEIPQFFSNKFEPLISLLFIINYIIIAFKIRNQRYDRIIFLSVRNDSLFWTYPLFKKRKIAVFHHNDIDRTLGRPFEKVLFRRLQNKITHIVLADFIQDGMVKALGTNIDNISVVYQPLINENPKEYNASVFLEDKYIVGLGRSTNEKFINQLIDKDKKNVEPLKYKIIIRSKYINYSSENLLVTTDYYSREEFDSIMNNATACIVLYDNFNLRYSGIIDDAFSKNKPVIGNNIPVFNYFSKKYPGCCFIINSADELYSLAAKDIPSINQNMFSAFHRLHSNEYVKSQIYRIFNK